MPKMKTNKGAAKRFKVRGSGSIKRRRAFRNHILSHMKKKVKRQMRHMVEVCQCDVDSVKRMLKIKS